MTRHPKYPEYVLVPTVLASKYFTRHPDASRYGAKACTECPDDECQASCNEAGGRDPSMVWVKELTAVIALLEDGDG